MVEMKLKKGSAKNVWIESEAIDNEPGKGFFEFKDDYSIFDYGVMPDEIPGKSRALAVLSAFNLQEISKQGVKTHFVSFQEPNKMKVELVRIIQPEDLKEGETNYLIPLEVIFRNSLPDGSSVFRRVKKGEVSWKDFGLDHEPSPGEKLSEPLLDVGTKLEPVDRYLSWSDAQALAKLDDEQLNQVKEIASKVNEFVSKKAKSLGLFHEDGKIECAVNSQGEVILLDVFGTPDENRFDYNGVEISKQVLRNYYRKTPWYAELREAQDAKKPKNEWPKPPSLPQDFISIVSDLYSSFAQEWTGLDFNVPSLADSVSAYKKFVG